MLIPTWLRPVYDVLHRALCKESVLHGDETTLQVLRESGKASTSKSYMWLYLDAGVIPKFARCTVGVQWFKDRGLWQDNSYEPCPGDIIFFDWNSGDGQDGSPDHVGIVEKVENGVVYTVEGNSSDRCRERRYAIEHYEIFGYGTPTY